MACKFATIAANIKTHTHITQLREYENTDEERKTKKAVQMAFPWQCSQWNCFTLANVYMNAAQYRIKNESKANKEKQDDR